MRFLTRGTIVALVLGLLLGFGFAWEAQSRMSGFTELADEKAQLSKLDVILLTARVRSIEYKLAHDSRERVFEVGMRYDKSQNQLVVGAFVNPDWINNSKLDEIQSTLTTAALNYCVDGISLAASEQGVLEGIKVSENLAHGCNVRFFTWQIGKTGVERKDIAQYVDAKLVLE